MSGATVATGGDSLCRTTCTGTLVEKKNPRLWASRHLLFVCFVSLDVVQTV